MSMRNSKNKSSLFIISVMYFLISLITLVIIIALSSSLQAFADDVGSSNIIFHTTNPSNLSTHLLVFPTGSKPYNLTYGEWTAKWWQWAYSIPKNIHPAYDDTGKNCAQKQNGPVWFLPGTYGHPVTRICDIPAGKAILFPILNSECSFAEFPNLKTLDELRMCAETIEDQVTGLYASVDGVIISNPEKYRVQSPPFNFTLPQDNILGMPSGIITQAVADGHWIFLPPLPPGDHKIVFKGEVQQAKIRNGISNGTSGSSFAFPSGWNFQTTYNLKVENETNDHYSYGVQ